MRSWVCLYPFGSYIASGSANNNGTPSVLSPLHGLNLSSVPVASASLRLTTEDTNFSSKKSEFPVCLLLNAFGGYSLGPRPASLFLSNEVSNLLTEFSKVLPSIGSQETRFSGFFKGKNSIAGSFLNWRSFNRQFGPPR